MAYIGPGLYSLVTNEVWKPSVFRPPVLQKRSHPPSKTTLTPMARPWYPTNAINGSDGTNAKAPTERRNASVPLPPPALGQSPTSGHDVEKEFLAVSSSSAVAPLVTTGVPCRPTAFTDVAMETRVYPVDMFMSISKDAAHTPYGVFRWAVKQYVSYSYLEVPAHLKLSLRDCGSSAPEVGTRGLMGSCLKVKSRAKPVRLTHHKVLSILSRLTEAKYDTLMSELKLLPLRQVEEDELGEICKIVFEKAVNEPSYTSLYARLAQDICQVNKGSGGGESMCDEGFQRRFRRMLVKLCEVQFHQPLQLSAGDIIDRTTGAPLNEEEVEMKRSRLKHRLVGNIRFVAELFKVGVLSGRVVREIVQILVSDYNPDEPTAKEEHVFELFTTLLRLTAVQLKDGEVDLLVRSLGIAKTIELSHPKPRVRFLMMDLGDLNRKNEWVRQDLIQRHVKERKQPIKAPCPASAGAASTTSTPVVKKTEKYSSRPREVSSSAGFENEGSPSTDSRVDTHTPSDMAHGNRTVNGNAGGGNVKIAGLTGNNKRGGPAGICGRSSSINESTSVQTSSKLIGPPSANGPHRLSHNPYFKLSPTNILDPRNGDGKSANGNFHPPQTGSPLSPVGSSTDLSLSSSSSGFPCGSQTNGGAAIGGDLRSPCAERGGAAIERKMNIEKITIQLMALFRSGDRETAVNVLHTMGLKNTVMCLTWWLRLATTADGNTNADNSQCFDDYARVPALFCSLLSIRSDAYGASTLFSTVLEWIRFDMEKREYEHSPKMFEGIALLIQQCHLFTCGGVPHVETVREILHCGMFNVLLRELIVNGGAAAPICTLVRNCHPVSVEIGRHLCDPAGEERILFAAAQNRFHLLPYLLCAGPAAGVEDHVTPLLPPRRDTQLAEWMPLTECLALPSAASDPELLLFVKMWDCAAADGGTAPLWQDEAVRLATDTGASGDSVASSLISVMRVVGALLVGLRTTCAAAVACDGGGGVQNVENGALASLADVHYVVGGILKQRPGALYQAAAVVELVVHHTRVLGGTAECPTFDAARLKDLQAAFDDWCEAGLVERHLVLELLKAADTSSDRYGLYPAYHNCIADVPWHIAVRSMGGN